MMLSSLYQKAIELIDKAYQKETNLEVFEGHTYPKEYLYALRMVDELKFFKAEATETELLAARCQHICRWEVPRNLYPLGRAGYHDWRTHLYSYQAEKAAEIMEQVGYNSNDIEEVKNMVGKIKIKLNEQTQLIEDVACLVFLKYYIDDFVEKHKDDEIKLIRIIHRTWSKMSDKGHQAALQLNIPEPIMMLITKALEHREPDN